MRLFLKKEFVWTFYGRLNTALNDFHCGILTFSSYIEMPQAMILFYRITVTRAPPVL